MKNEELTKEDLIETALKTLETTGELPNPHYDIFKHSQIYKKFRKMEYDEIVRWGWQKRYSTMMDQGWTISPASDSAQDLAVADFVTKNLQGFDFDESLEAIAKAILYGFSVAEIVWKEKDGTYFIDRIENKLAEEFQFSEDDDGKKKIEWVNGWLTSGDDLQSKYPYKIIYHKYGTMGDSPHGFGLLCNLFWLITFKNQGLTGWLKTLERSAVPAVIANLNDDLRGFDNLKDKVEYYTEQLKNLSYNATAAITGGEISMLQTNSDGEFFDKFQDLLKRGIALILTGTTALMGETSGSYSRDETHKDILKSLVVPEAAALSRTVNNTLVKYICDLNFGELKEYPEFSIITNEYANFDDVIKAIDKQIPISKKALYEVYNLPMPDPDDPEDLFIVEVADGGGNKEEVENNQDFFSNPDIYLP